MANLICNPDDEVSFEEHKHTCKECNTSWRHTDDVVDAPIEDYDEAHTCPACGATDQTLKIMDFGEIAKQIEQQTGRKPPAFLVEHYVKELAEDTQ